MPFSLRGTRFGRGARSDARLLEDDGFQVGDRGVRGQLSSVLSAGQRSLTQIIGFPVSCAVGCGRKGLMKVVYASGLVTRLGTGTITSGGAPWTVDRASEARISAGHLDWTNRVSLFIMLRRAVYAAVENAPRLGSVGNTE